MCERDRKNHAFFAGYAAVAIVSFLILIKAYAYYLSGAMSVLSSLTDSVMDSVVSVVALGSIYYAQRPADEDHRWGHGKMEAVSALFQAAIIIGGGVFLVFESVKQMAHPQPIVEHKTAIVVLCITIVLSVILIWIQRRSLQNQESLAIEADSAHYSSDIFINLGALAVIGGSFYGAPVWIDSAFAFVIALFMAVVARGIVMKSLNILLDREILNTEREKIIEIIENHKGVLGWHDLRTRRNGVGCVISFDIEADGEQSLRDAHGIAKDLEEALVEVFSSSEVFIHIDPEGMPEDLRHRVKGVHR